MTLVAGSVCDNVEIPEPDFSSDSERDVAATKLMAVFEKNGCVASQRNVMRLAKADGMTEQQIDIAGEALEDAGGFTETDDGLQLMFGKCKGATPDINAQYKSGVKTLETEGKLAVIVRIFEENECTLTQEKATSLFAEEGIESSEVRGLVKPLMNEGHLVPRDGAVMLVSGEVCG